MEKVSRRVTAVEEVRSHVRALQEMLSMYREPGQALPDQQALQVSSSDLRLHCQKREVLHLCVVKVPPFLSSLLPSHAHQPLTHYLSFIL